MADSLVFEESINTEVSSHDFTEKQWLYVNDNNNASYSGQVVIDTTALSNCGSYINWSESFLAIPLVLQAEGTAITATNSLDYMMGLKNGFWQIIHSMAVEFNNGSIIQQTPFLNVFASFKNLTSWSLDDIDIYGSVTGFYQDTPRTWLYNPNNTAASLTNFLNTSGQGICNNRNAPFIQTNSYGSWSGSFVAGVTSTAVTAITTLSGYLQVGMAITGINVPAGVVVSAIVYDANGNPLTATLSTATGATALTNQMPLVGNGVGYNITTATNATTDTDNFRSLYNNGFAIRQSWLNNTGSTAMVANPAITALSANQTQLLVNANASYSQIFMSYVRKGTGYRAIIFDAVVRLKDIADFFQKVPLLKGSTMRLYINTNQTYFTCGVVAPTITGAYSTTATLAGTTLSQTATGCLALTSAPIILGGGNTNPVMVASMDIGQGSANLVSVLGTTAPTPVSVAFGLSIVKTQFSQFTNQFSAPITSVRLYAPAYTMSPLAEQRYLSLASTKKVVYNDIFYYTFPSIAANSTFSFLVSNGLPNIRSVLCFPNLPKASQGTASTYASTTTALAGTTASSLLSPFSTTGGTPDPIAITNFQIQISGKNLFINNLQYDFENFVEQFVQSNSLNGGLTTSMSSGLIGYEEWTTTYRYYYGNASRSIPSEDGVAKAVQVSGLNLSGVVIDMMVFIEFQREIVIDVRTGARVG